MKRIFFILLLMPLFSLAQDADHGSVLNLDSKYGFKDIKLEGDFLEIKKNVKLRLIDSSDGKRNYEIIDKKYFLVGDCKLKDVTIVVFQNKVHQIYITTKGLTNSQCFFRSLRELFGRPEQANEYIEDYMWIGEKATCYYSENSVTNDAGILISSNYMDNLYKGYQQDQSQKGSKDF